MRGGGELNRSLGSEFLSGRAACDRGACFSGPFSPWHVEALVAPVDVLYFPSPQSSQVASFVAPVDVLYFPSPQSSHVASLVAPVDVLYFPSPQSSHVETPVDALYFPSPQSWQAERRFEVVGL